MARMKYEHKPDYAIMPGATLKEAMEYKNLSLRELSKRTDITEQSLIRILRGKQPITHETALKLEPVTGISSQFWNSLESKYREQLLLIEERKEISSIREWLKQIPLTVLEKGGFITASTDVLTTARQVFSFFGVSSINAWKNIWDTPELAARRSECFNTNIGYASVWVRQGEIKAQTIETPPYDKSKFYKALLDIKSMTADLPERFDYVLQQKCAQCGVAVVFVPEMKGVPWNGATKWMSPHKAMIIMNIRGKKDDKFWFSFFHEACHVLKHGKKQLNINDNSNDDQEEVEANNFAADFLIPSCFNEQIQAASSSAEIEKIAIELGIAPGIVAGRYQYLTGNWAKFNNLKITFAWDSND
jgi:addiction module HigA family antidote